MLYLKDKDEHEEAQAVLERYNDELAEAYDAMLEHRDADTLKAYRTAVSAFYAIAEVLEALELGGATEFEEGIE